jgi:hypothetical protein
MLDENNDYEKVNILCEFLNDLASQLVKKGKEQNNEIIENIYEAVEFLRDDITAAIKENKIESPKRVGSSPIRYPCFLGMDFPTRAELAAAGLTVEELGRRVIQADSLGYLSLEGMIRASGLPKENLCLGCFTGEYPVEPPRNCNRRPPSY